MISASTVLVFVLYSHRKAARFVASHASSEELIRSTTPTQLLRLRIPINDNQLNSDRFFSRKSTSGILLAYAA